MLEETCHVAHIAVRCMLVIFCNEMGTHRSHTVQIGKTSDEYLIYIIPRTVLYSLDVIRTTFHGMHSCLWGEEIW